MRRIQKPAVVFLFMLLLVGLLTIPGFAAPKDIQVFLNGQMLHFDVPPTIVSGRTLVPLRAIFEALNAKVAWDNTSQTVSATWNGGELALPVGKTTATVNGSIKTLDVPAQIINNRTLVPLRFVAETLGANVGWYGKSQAITINTPPKAPIEVKVTRVVDGDTVEVTMPNGQTEDVRLIGVDTPETVHPTKGEQPYGREASNFTKEHLAGQTVFLETDVEERDRYGRLLAYVYLPNGVMYNAVLVDEGYAQMATFPPNVRYVEVFKALQTAAREGNRGLWGLSGEQTPATQPSNATGKIKGNINSKGEKIYHVPGGAYYDITDAEEYFDTEEEAQAAGYRRSSR